MTHLIRKQVIDKNGKVTTVRVRPEEEAAFNKRLPKPTTNVKKYEQNDVNKLIRQSLKDAFPGVKFSVTKYGEAANIAYEDGPPAKEVEAVVGAYIGSDRDYNFDTVTMKSFMDEEGDTVYFYNHYAFVRRSASPEAMYKARQILGKEIGVAPENLHRNNEIDVPYDMYHESREVNEFGEQIYRPLNGIMFVSEVLEFITEREAYKARNQ